MLSFKLVYDLGCGIKVKEGEGNLIFDVCFLVYF